MISSVLPPIESENSAFCVSNVVRRRKINRKVRHIELRNRQDSLYTGRAETSSESPFPLEVRSLNACSCCPFGHWIIAILTSPSAKITSSCFSLSPCACCLCLWKAVFLIGSLSGLYFIAERFIQRNRITQVSHLVNRKKRAFLPNHWFGALYPRVLRIANPERRTIERGGSSL